MQTKFKRAASAVLAIITLVSMLMVGGIMPASADDTVTVKSNGYVFSYNAGGTWTSDLDGFSVSDGSLAICTQLDVNPPGSGGATYKLATNLGTSYNDGGTTINTKFVFKAFYYAEKNRSTNSALKDLNTYQLTLAINCVARNYFSNLTVSAGTNTFSQNIISAVQTIRNMANTDADKIDSKITIKDGVATCETTGYTARMAFFTSTTSGTQRIMIYDARWQPREENGAIEVYKKDGDGKALAGATFTVYDSTGKVFTTIGPTDSKGYAISDGGADEPSIPLGTYTVVETVFPANYTHNGTTSWTVTVKANETAKIGGNAGVTNVLKKGAIGAVKVDADGNPLSGVTFGVYSNAACTTKVGEMTTNAQGKATYGVSGSTYSLDCTKTFYVKEIKAQSSDYTLNTKVYSATIVANTVTYVNSGNGIPNYLKNGALSAYKTDASGKPLAGVVFGVYSDKDCTKELARMTTGNDGMATYGVAADGSFTLTCRQTLHVQEIEPKDDTYIRDDTIYDVTIVADKITPINGGDPIVNVQKYWELELTKVDAETGKPSIGDISTDGAVYGLFNANDEKLAEYTVEGGKFTTDKFVAATGYYLQELIAPVGFRLDDTKIRLDNLVAPIELTAELTTVQKTAIETPKAGNLSIVKFTPPHSNDDTTYIPEEGAEFVAYLSSFGSYDAAVAAGDSRFYDNCVVNASGVGVWSNDKTVSKDLVYGTYTVHQTKAAEGRAFVEDFTVEVKEDGKTYSYTLNNRVYDTTLIVHKKDAETGELIVNSPASFKIKDLATGEFVFYSPVYPEKQTIDEFNTTKGSFTLPVKLPYGHYELIETKAPEGYILNADPIRFSVTSTTADVTEIDVDNIPQKGVIRISKSGEVFSSVIEENGLYQPVYAAKGLAGAEYTVTAAEDIITADGTVRHHKGDVVGTVTTGADGTVKTAPLYLGTYTVTETKAPHGMVLNGDPHTVTLAYAGQETTITETSTSFVNERQKVQIDLLKELEQDDVFGIGMNDEILSVQFGLFVAEDLTAADGSVIPADGLLEIVNCSAEGATFETDTPVGSKLYVEEIAADEHYVVSNTQYSVVFEYAGQDIALVTITVNDGEAIPNEILYGTIKGLKIDRETGATIAGAVFGLFAADETDFTEDTAILTAVSDEEGVFLFENIPFGTWSIHELKPAEGYLANDETYAVTVTEDGEIVEITVENDLIPELGTTATVDGQKEITASDVVTIEDVVSYTNLTPGKEYTIKGILMDKTTGKSFLVDGQEICSEVTFIPETSTGEVNVVFSFNGSAITADTELVVFESLYREDMELTAHADIDDVGQTVTVHPQPAPPITQTGDTSPWGALVALAGSSAIVVAGKKRKKAHE